MPQAQPGPMPAGLHPAVAQQLAAMLQALESSLVTDEVVHSLHIQALRVPEVAALPAMERFNKASLDHLHTKVALAGFVRRALVGEATADVRKEIIALTKQLHQRYEMIRESLKAIVRHEAARETAPVAMMRQLFSQVAQGQRTAMMHAQSLFGTAEVNVGAFSADEWTL